MFLSANMSDGARRCLRVDNSLRAVVEMRCRMPRRNHTSAPANPSRCVPLVHDVERNLPSYPRFDPRPCLRMADESRFQPPCRSPPTFRRQDGRGAKGSRAPGAFIRKLAEGRSRRNVYRGFSGKTRALRSWQRRWIIMNWERSIGRSAVARVNELVCASIPAAPSNPSLHGCADWSRDARHPFQDARPRRQFTSSPRLTDTYVEPVR